MYSTCLYCTRSLGANDVLETLPVGRRIAFDAAAGRLWVVCKSCACWNLVPFENRLETIDACEAIFRDSRMRFSTDNIGLARLLEGLELVRIGPALRPEFAAWRYGDRFVSRRRRNIAIAATVGTAAVGGMFGLHALVGGAVFSQLPIQFYTNFYQHRVAARFVRDEGGEPITLTRADIHKSTLHFIEGPPATWGLSVPARVGVRGRLWSANQTKERLHLTGHDAIVGLGAVLPVISGLAGSKGQVRSAVSLVEEHTTIERMLSQVRTKWTDGVRSVGKLSQIASERRLALEMLAHEDAERTWLEGELKLLERQWREADRYAAIADQLAISATIEPSVPGPGGSAL